MLCCTALCSCCTALCAVLCCTALCSCCAALCAACPRRYGEEMTNRAEAAEARVAELAAKLEDGSGGAPAVLETLKEGLMQVNWDFMEFEYIRGGEINKFGK